MSDPTTVAEEFVRASAAEKLLSDRLVKLEPPPPPPPAPTLEFTTTLVDGQEIKGSAVDWRAIETVGHAHHVDFTIDGKLVWPEASAPWGGLLDTKNVPNIGALLDGPHFFGVTAYDSLGIAVPHPIVVKVANGVVIPPPPPPPPAAGLGIASGSASSKNNYQIGRSRNGDVAMRIRKRGTGPVSGFRWQQRFGTTYSGGDGGSLRATLQLEVAGKPSGTPLASKTYKPGTNGGKADAAWGTTLFDTPSPSIPDGTIYYIVLEGDNATGWISVNTLYKWGDDAGMPRQPTFTDAELAFLKNTGAGWVVTNDTPNIDVLPNHEGFGYTQCLTQYWQAVGGSARGLNPQNALVTRGSASGNVVRQVFTSAVPFPVRILQMRLRLDHGSSPVKLTLKSQAGVVIATGSVPASQVRQGTSGGDNGGQTWAIATVPPITAPAGTYYLEASAPGDTAYTVTPIRKAVVDNVTGSDWQSFMANGYAEYSTGGAFAPLYASVKNQTDTQFAVLP